MPKPRVWFSRASSSLHPVLLTLKQTPTGGGLEILASHPQWDAPALCASDVAMLEPDLKGAEYASWCLDFCRQHRVQVLVPGRARADISLRRDEFAAIGTRLVVAADGPTLTFLEDKPAFLADVPPEIAPVSRYIKVNTRQEFVAAVELLRAEGIKVCFKPGRSTFGLGFHLLDDELSPVSRLLDGHANVISLAEASDILGREEHFRDVLVMEYLGGPEYSVDCVGRAGEIVCAVVRTKPKTAMHDGTSQFIGGNDEIELMVRQLAARYRLEGLFNMQFRAPAEGGTPKLLEINGRMSGGLALACLSGIHLLEVAINLVLAGADVPLPGVVLPIRPVRAQQSFSAFPAAHLISSENSLLA